MQITQRCLEGIFQINVNIYASKDFEKMIEIEKINYETIFKCI